MAKEKDGNEDLAAALGGGEATAAPLQSINILGKIVGFVVLIWLASVSRHAVAFFLIGMLPAIITAFLDRGRGRFASKTVTATNFIGIVPYLFEISRGPTSAYTIAAKRLMANSETWWMIYSSAATGLIMIWLIPQITLIIFTIRSDIRAKNMEREQEALIAEWGEKVKQSTKKKKR
jgi:hypothetical protein